MSSSKYWEQAPVDGVADRIEGWCFSEDEAQPPAIRVLPDAEVSILFSAPAAGEAWEATVHGATTRASIVQQSEPRLQIQARLAPGAAASVLGANLRELRDEAVPLPDLWGREADGVLSVLARAGSWPERRRVIERMFARGRAPIEPTAELVRRATREIRGHRGRLRIDALCAALGTQRRQLERSFAYHLGVSPKLLSRIVRFRSAREGVRDGTPTAQVALAAGYSDQAHMTREFQAFAGVPPSLLGSAVVFVQPNEDGS